MKLMRWALYFILPLIASPGRATEQVMLVLGDSLSAAYGIATGKGWVDLMQARLTAEKSPWRVVNASISGETTSGGLSRLPELLERHQPKLVLIELGSNDGLRGLSLGQIEDNLRRMVELSRQSGSQVILVGARLPPNYGPAYTGAFFGLFEKVATSTESALIPFLLEGVAEDRSLLQADALHPTAQAQPRLLENVWSVMQGLL